VEIPVNINLKWQVDFAEFCVFGLRRAKEGRECPGIWIGESLIFGLDETIKVFSERYHCYVPRFRYN